jgi:hypothetical protein
MNQQMYTFRVGSLKTKKQRANYLNRHRSQYFGRPCRVLRRGKMNSVLIEFCETGEKLITSANFIQKLKSR